MFPLNSKILICDDSPISRALIRRVLVEKDFESIDEAECAEEVIDILIENNNKHFDLLLLDIMMPGIPGTDLVKIIRESKTKFKNMSIIMISSEAEKSTVLKALVNGANEYILKPVESETIMKKMQSVWNKLPETQKSNIILRSSIKK